MIINSFLKISSSFLQISTDEENYYFNITNESPYTIELFAIPKEDRMNSVLRIVIEPESSWFTKDFFNLNDYFFRFVE